MNRAIMMLVLGILLAIPAYSAEEKIAFISYGDFLEGRKAFIDLKCMRCHRVLGDSSLPKPTAGPAPILGGLNAEHSTEELSQAMTAPSHSIAPGFEANANGLSPMTDFSRQMTVRQLIDVVAYLKEAENTDAPWPKEGP